MFVTYIILHLLLITYFGLKESTTYYHILKPLKLSFRVIIIIRTCISKNVQSKISRLTISYGGQKERVIYLHYRLHYLKRSVAYTIIIKYRICEQSYKNIGSL